MITLKQWRKRTENAVLLILLYDMLDEDATPESIRLVLKHALKVLPVLERELLKETDESAEEIMNKIDKYFEEPIVEETHEPIEPYEPLDDDEIIKARRIRNIFEMSREEGYARGYRDGKLLVLPTISICISIFAIIIKFIL